MEDLPGARGAGPIWHNFMEEALADMPPRDFPQPPSIIELEVCADSGTLPSQACPQRRTELFAVDQPPLGPEHDLHQLLRIDRLTGKLATDFCPNNVVIEKYFMVFPEEYRQWAEEHGHPQPPAETCPLHAYPPQVAFFQPQPNQSVQGIVPLIGQVQMPDFSHYNVEWGVGDNPIGWGWVSGPHEAEVENGQLTAWDSSISQNGVATLRVVVYDHQGNSVEGRVQVVVNNPMPIPTSTATVAPTPTDTPIPMPMPSPTPTPGEPMPTLLPTVVPTPTDTPVVKTVEPPIPGETVPLPSTKEPMPPPTPPAHG